MPLWCLTCVCASFYPFPLLSLSGCLIITPSSRAGDHGLDLGYPEGLCGLAHYLRAKIIVTPDVSQYLFLSHHFELFIYELSRYKA